MTIEMSPGGQSVLNRIAEIAILSTPACGKALRRIIGKQLQETIGAFRLMKTPGGEAWAPNPEDYATFKRNVLGQSPDQIGVQNGQLRQSMASEMNEAALEGRVGSSDKNAQSFHAGGPIPPLVFIYGRGTWLPFWFDYGQTSPGRRFVPEAAYAEKQAAEITERVLATEIKRHGVDIAGRLTGLDFD